MPLDEWLSKGLKDYFYGILDSSDSSSKLFDKRYIKKIFERYSSSKLYYGRQIWNLGVFSIWHKIYVENEKPNLF